MQVKIVDVKLTPKTFKGQTTNYYILKAEDGKEYKVSEKSRYTFQNVHGVGLYEIELGEYMGHEVIKKLRPLQTAGPNTISEPVKAAALATKQAAANDKALLTFATAKQNEIKLECYAGIAKEVLIASGKKDIKPIDIMQYAKDLMLLHNDIIALGEDLPGYGVSFLKDLKEAFPEAYVEKTTEAQPVQQTFTEEEPPF